MHRRRLHPSDPTTATMSEPTSPTSTLTRVLTAPFVWTGDQIEVLTGEKAKKAEAARIEQLEKEAAELEAAKMKKGGLVKSTADLFGAVGGAVGAGGVGDLCADVPAVIVVARLHSWRPPRHARV